MTSNIDDLCFVNSSRFYQFLLIKKQIVLYNKFQEIKLIIK